MLSRMLSGAGTPAGPVVQRRLVVDGVPVRELSHLRKETLDAIMSQTGSQLPSVVKAVIEAMIDDPAVMRRSLDELVREIPRVIDLAFGDASARPDDTADTVRLARRVAEDLGQQDRLKSSLPGAGGTFPAGRQLRPVNELLAINPALAHLLAAAGIRIHFASSKAKGLGGLYTHEDLTVHLDPLVSDSPPSVFLRLLLHELGHATFQQMILGAGDQLLATPGDAQALHAAWQVLRRDSGRHLLGLDLGGGRSATERKAYQANDFHEFCAESFMMRVVEPDRLNLYVRYINSPRNRIPAEVRDAWRDVVVILDKYERRIMR
jgi:hypothetical protein